MAQYKRVLIKLSGEALGDNGRLFDFEQIDRVAGIIGQLHATGTEIAIVIGAGNIWRGRQGGKMDRVRADSMGMLATTMNALALQDTFIQCGIPTKVMTAVPMLPMAENYSSDVAKRYLSEGKVVIFGAGLGMPFLSTDTAGAVRASEIGADAMFMAKNIDYIYTDDPRTNPNAQKLEAVSASEVLSRDLKAIDATATAFCRANGIPIRVFGLKEPSDIVNAISGKSVGTVVTPD